MLKKFDLMYEEFKKNATGEVLEEAISDWSMDVIHDFEDAKKYAEDTKWSFTKDEKYVEMYKPIAVIVNKKTNKKYACSNKGDKFNCTDEADAKIEYKQFINTIPKGLYAKLVSLFNNKVVMTIVNTVEEAKPFKKTNWDFVGDQGLIDLYKPIVILSDDRTGKKYAIANSFTKMKAYDEHDISVPLATLVKLIPAKIWADAIKALKLGAGGRTE